MSCSKELLKFRPYSGSERTSECHSLETLTNHISAAVMSAITKQSLKAFTALWQFTPADGCQSSQGCLMWGPGSWAPFNKIIVFPSKLCGCSTAKWCCSIHSRGSPGWHGWLRYCFRCWYVPWPVLVTFSRSIEVQLYQLHLSTRVILEHIGQRCCVFFLGALKYEAYEKQEAPELRSGIATVPNSSIITPGVQAPPSLTASNEPQLALNASGPRRYA